MTPEQLESAIEDAGFYLVWQSWPNSGSFGPDIALASCDRRHLVSWALTGWHPAVVILRDTALHLRSMGDPLPLWLQDYLLASKTGPSRKPGRHRLDNLLRDLAIALTVEATAERYSLNPTRNTTATTESGSSIVTRALERLGIHMSEANVKAIWQRIRSLGDEMRAEAPSVISLTELMRLDALEGSGRSGR